MKNNILVMSAFIFSMVACSKDDSSSEEETGLNAIIGTWAATELQFDGDASDELEFGKQILDDLTENDCTILTFTFNEDLSLVFENSANYLSIGATNTGLTIPCPTELDITNSVYTYDGETITTFNDDQEVITVGAIVEGDILTVDAADLDIPNFNDGGTLIFERQ